MMHGPLNRIVPFVSPFVVFCLLFVQLAGLLPCNVLAQVPEELKKIEYQYYFRGRYEEAIQALRTLLERPDLAEADQREAREFLAAALILTDSTPAGKDEYLKILNRDGTYAGPDPEVFQPAIIAVFNEARIEYASMVIQRATELKSASATAGAGDRLVTGPAKEKKPIYKKWWFYTAIGVVVVAAAASAAKEEEVAAVDHKTGTVSVGVTIK